MTGLFFLLFSFRFASGYASQSVFVVMRFGNCGWWFGVAGKMRKLWRTCMNVHSVLEIVHDFWWFWFWDWEREIFFSVCVLVLFWTEYCVAGKKNLTMNALEEFHHVLQLCVFWFWTWQEKRNLGFLVC